VLFGSIANMHKLITILGPTATGKSSLGIELAQKFNGEIVSADSRQVFRGLNIGSGKVTADEQAQIPHHLLDIVNPMEEFSVAHFQGLAFTAIDDILSRKKLPFLVGGTALYIYSVIDNYIFTDVPPNPKRRKELEGKSVEELQNIIKSSNDTQPPPNPLLSKGGGTLSRDDLQNPRRLIRAIEKLEAGVSIEPKKAEQKYNNIILGINFSREELYKRIDMRVDERIKNGMIEEVKNLINTWPKATRSLGEGWLIRLGLEYRYITEYLQKKHTKDEMIKGLKHAIHMFSKRQMTWFKLDKRIHWIKNSKQAEKFL